MDRKMDGERVRQFLDEKQKRPEWLAVELSVSLATVQLMLAGRAPKQRTVQALSVIMGVPVEEILLNQDRQTA